MMMRCALLVASLALVHGRCATTIDELAGWYTASSYGVPLGIGQITADGTLSVDIGSFGTLDGPWVTRPEPPRILQSLWPSAG